MVQVGFTVVLTPMDGDTNLRLYLNTVNTTTKSCAHCGWPYCGTTPCTAGHVSGYNRLWSSDTTPDPLVVEIDVMDPYYEAGEQYIVAVGSVLPGVTSTFTLTATFSTGIITLRNMIPMRGGAPAGSYAYYTLNMVNPGVQLQAIVTALDGSPELYVSVNSSNRRPTAAWWVYCFDGLLYAFHFRRLTVSGVAFVFQCMRCVAWFAILLYDLWQTRILRALHDICVDSFSELR